MSLKLKFNLLITLILLFTIVSLLFGASFLVEKSQKESFKDSLIRTNKVFESLIKTQRQSLKNQSKLVGVLPILTTVVEDGDVNTVGDTSKSYQKDLGSEIFDVYDSDGELIVSVLQNQDKDDPENLSTIIEQTLEGESLVSYATRNGLISLIGTAPIGLAEEPTGVLIVGTFLNHNFAKKIQELTKVHVSFIINNKVTGTSLKTPKTERMIQLLQNKSNTNDTGLIEGKENFLYVVDLKSQEESIGQVVLLMPLDELYFILAEIRKYLIGIGICIFIIAIVIGILYAKTITNPIAEAVDFASDLAKGELEHAIHQNRQDEIGKLQGSLEKMRLSLKDFIENLDKKIHEKTRDISLILEHIPIGLLTIDMEGKTGPEYSAISENFFNGKPTEKSIEKTIFEDPTKQTNFKDWFDFLPLSPMPFEDTAGLAPDEETFNHDENSLELSYEFTPIYKEGSDNEYEKIMLIAKDITEAKHLEAEMKAKEEKTDFILKVLKSKDGYINFLKECKRCINELETLLPNILDGNPSDNVTAAFRSAHTIKGNASAYGVSEIKDAADQLETALMKGRDQEVEVNKEFQENITKLIPVIAESFKAHIHETETTFGESFDPDAGAEKTFSITHSHLIALMDATNNLSTTDSSKKLIQLVKDIELEPINVFLQPYVDQVSALAERLEKQIHPLVIENGEIKVNTDRLTPFFSSFVHLIRNCVDHGIENVDERTNAQKSDFATICIDIQEKNDDLIIRVSDDGRGINPDIIKNKAIEKSIISEEQAQKMSSKDIQLLVFSAGFSTKEEVTSTSGRGVGMDAVKHEAEKLGGHIDIDSQVGKGTTFIITLPNNDNFDHVNGLSESRQFTRIDLDEYSPVYFDNQQEAGMLINISPDGFLLANKDHIKENEEMQFHIKTPSEESIIVVAEARRSKKDSSGKYETGFLIKSFGTPKDEETYSKLIRKR